MLKSFGESPRGKTFYLAKKGRKYVREKNGEFALTTRQSEAIAFESESAAKSIISQACADTRNAEIIGRSFGLVAVRKP